MNNRILAVIFLAVATLPSTAEAYAGGRSSSFVSIGIYGSQGSFSYSSYHTAPTAGYYRSMSRRVRHSYTGSYRRTRYNGYRAPMQTHIYRQQGRRYINDCSPYPIVIVPARRQHRHYQGCGCRY